MSLGYTDTPFLPGGLWRVHDADRPQPPVISPATPAADTPASAPSDAQILFDGSSLDGWRRIDGRPAGWRLVEGGAMEVVGGTGDIQTTAELGDIQLHLEFRCPTPPRGDGQGRGNSGVFLLGRYEVQVLDCWENPTYADGTVGAIYGQYPPRVNASRAPGLWQSYDILFSGPRFETSGACIVPASLTILLNGVVVQYNARPIGLTTHRVVGVYQPHPIVGPLRLQDHGDPVQFRNIWARSL